MITTGFYFLVLLLFCPRTIPRLLLVTPVAAVPRLHSSALLLLHSSPVLSTSYPSLVNNPGAPVIRLAVKLNRYYRIHSEVTKEALKAANMHLIEADNMHTLYGDSDALECALRKWY